MRSFQPGGQPGKPLPGSNVCSRRDRAGAHDPKAVPAPPPEANERFAQELDLSRRHRVGGRWWLPSFAASLSRQVPAEDLLQLFLAELLRVCPRVHAQQHATATASCWSNCRSASMPARASGASGLSSLPPVVRPRRRSSSDGFPLVEEVGGPLPGRAFIIRGADRMPGPRLKQANQAD